MEEMHSRLATEKVGKLKRKYSIPCVVSLFVRTLYQTVDRIYIANAQDLGSYGNAAITAVYRVFS